MISNDDNNNDNGETKLHRPFLISWDDDDNNNDGKDDDDNNYNEDEYCEVLDEYGLVAYESFCEQTNNAGDSTFRWIRVEKSENQEVRLVRTHEQVLQKIQEAKSLQSQFGRSDLYSRQWISTSTHFVDGENYKRRRNGQCTISVEEEQEVNGAASTYSSSRNTFSVLQFNALAEGLCAGPNSSTPFVVDPRDEHGQSEKNSYGGFTDIPFPAVTLDSNLRRWRLLEVLLGGGGKNGVGAFDIIALEEMDRYRGFFAPILKRIYGYEGLFVPKTRSPSVRMGWYSDGCALFWRKSVFQLVSKKTLEYKVGNQIMILATLQHLPSNKHLLVAVTHLKAQNSEMNEKIRVAQVQELLNEIQSTQVDSILILGDFNAEPLSESVRLITGFRSAYNLSSESLYTTWKTRGRQTKKRIIDYIFYSGPLHCQAILSIPTEQELEPTKLPGLRYPSDHLALGAQFSIY